MSFGYSVGDVIAGANLTYRLIRIMAETKGASVEYLEAMTELSAMQQAFLQISEIRSNKMLPSATINAASHIVLSSMDTIAKFLERSKHYQRLLENPRASSFQSSWYKVGWTLYKSHELCTLRDTLHSRLTSVQTLLSAASYCVPLPATMAQYQVDNQSSPALPTLKPSQAPSPPLEGDSTHGRDLVTAENKPGGSNLSSPTPEQNNQTIPALESGNTRKFIYFKDAVGRKFKFPWEMSNTWSGMEEFIQQAFTQVKTLGPHVMEGHYDLIGPEGEIILPSAWAETVEPDMAIAMAMWPIEKLAPPRRPTAPGQVPIAEREVENRTSSKEARRNQSSDGGDSRDIRLIERLRGDEEFARRIKELDVISKSAVIKIVKDMRKLSIITRAERNNLIEDVETMSFDSFINYIGAFKDEISTPQTGSETNSTRNSSRQSTPPASVRDVAINAKEYQHKVEEDSRHSTEGQDNEPVDPASESEDWEDCTDDESIASNKDDDLIS